MKTLILAMIASLIGSAAHAGWTGCSIGLTGGLHSTNTDTSVTSPLAPPGSALDIDGLGADDVQGGLRVGCDGRLQQFVIGAFADYVWQEVEWKAGLAVPPILNATAATALGDQWSIGARAGYLATPTTLIYGVVGYTEAESDPLVVTVNTASTSFSVEDAKGWFVGAGMETAIWKDLYLGAEYRYTRFDDRAIDLAAVIPGRIDLDTDSHAVRMTLSYKFGPAENIFEPTK